MADQRAIDVPPDRATRLVVILYDGDRSRLAGRLQLAAGVWAIAASILAIRLHIGVLALLALVPLAYLRLPPSILQRLPAGEQLVPQSPYRVEFDQHGMTFGEPDVPPRTVPWDTIDRMETDRWCTGRLIARDGSVIAALPPGYVRPQRGFFRAPTLAVYAVRTRPDLFALSRPVNRFTQPYGFLRPDVAYRPPDLAGIGRRQALLQVLLVASLVAVLAAVMFLTAK